MHDETKTEVTPQIWWPDFSFPPVNLTVLVSAWFFYATPAERETYFKELLK